MKLRFVEEDLSERQECSALTSIMEGTALNCMMAKKQYQLDTAEKIFEIFLNRFGSGMQEHQALMRFEKGRQREDETMDQFLDDLEMLRRRNQPDESNRRMNLAIASKFIDGLKNDDFRTMLATHYTPLSTYAPTPEELRLKSKEYLSLKRPSRSGYYKKTIMAILTTDQPTKETTGTNHGTIWRRDTLLQIAVRRTIMCQHVNLQTGHESNRL